MDTASVAAHAAARVDAASATGNYIGEVMQTATTLAPSSLADKPALLACNLDGITHKSLADALKRLERHGLATRTVIPTTPIGVRYTITPLGRSCATGSF